MGSHFWHKTKNIIIYATMKHPQFIYKTLKDKHGEPKETTLAVLRKADIWFRGHSHTIT